MAQLRKIFNADEDRPSIETILDDDGDIAIRVYMGGDNDENFIDVAFFDKNGELNLYWLTHEHMTRLSAYLRFKDNRIKVAE